MTALPATDPGASGDHRLLFYDQEPDLIDAVAGFAADAIRDDTTVVLIVTGEHRAGLEDRLAALGLHPAEGRDSGRLTVLDARDTLALISVDGVPDPDAFERVVGTRVRRAAQRGRPVQIFGEMVALLWDAGDVVAAIELESLGCGLARSVHVDLMCAYPATALVAADGSEAVNQVCDLHTDVRLSASTGIDPLMLRAYPPRSEAVREARHVLAGLLDGHAGAEVIDAAQLIVSELSANAVRHAGTEFVVEAFLGEGALRVAVRDRDPRPLRRPPVFGEDRPSGRGLILVEALSRRWGVSRHDASKAVWAELDLP